MMNDRSLSFLLDLINEDRYKNEPSSKLKIPSLSSIVIVGGGKMGEAILSGWLASDSSPADAIEASNITVVNPGQERRDYLRRTYYVSCVEDVSQVKAASLVVLAVKPQVMMGVLEQISALPVFQVKQGFPLFVSIAAGITTDSIAQALPEGAPVVRVMPNMPLQVGEGASGVCGGPNAAGIQVALVSLLFDCLGRSFLVDESDMDAVCALSGSGPAYVAAAIEAMRDAAVEQGLDAELAEQLALQTVLGTAQLISQTDISPAAAREAVCSPGGTTLAALDAMQEAGFAQVYLAGIAAAVKRSKELADCS